MINTCTCLLFACAFFLCTTANSQNGWRSEEMEVKVIIQKKEDAGKLHELHLNGDVYQSSGYGLMYVIPGELEKIKSSGLSYEVVKNNLNKFYKDFWLNNEEQYRNSRALAEKYHSYAEIIALMDSLVAAFPTICKKISFGTSVQNRQLVSLKISDNVNVEENEPEVLLDGGIHGDEIGGAENTIRFARHLCTNYTKDVKITNLINNREIWIYPMINPDGRVNVTRSNGNNVDLNRDWGYMWNGEGSSPATYSQPETKAMRECMYTNQFVIHLNCHSGSQNVFFPWCHRSARAPDYSNFNTLSGLYASSSTYPSLICMQSNADYATTGELDDCSYGVNGTMGMVLEISTNKQPSVTEIPKYYQYNVPAMMTLLEYAGYGIEGVITDSITGNPVAAAIYVDNFYPVYSDPIIGDYHKFLSAGTHSIKIIANNYKTKIISNIQVFDKASTLTSLKLEPVKSHFIYKVVSAAIPGNNPSDEGNTPAVIGAPDQVSYSIGKSGTIIVDMQYPITDIAGNDIKVYEGDNSPEGYTCYAGQTMEGPWKLLGIGNGTTGFDLSAGSLTNAQFIKIVDAGNGTANANDAGFDLDAIEDLGNILTEIPFDEKADNSFTIHPNPFSDLITIYYSITNTTAVKLTIYNSLGGKIAVVNEKKNSAGKYSLQFNTAHLNSGIYYCTFETDANTPPVSKYIIKF